MKYTVELRNEESVEISKEFEEYNNAYDYSDKLIPKLKKNHQILIIENKKNERFVIRKLEIENKKSI